MKSSTSRALHMAHILDKSKPGHRWSEILEQAWYFERFRRALTEGVVNFTYRKKDNSLRDARGTLCENLIPSDDMPKGDMSDGAALRKPCFSSIAYYDIDKKAWRAFDIRLFIGYVEPYRLVHTEPVPGAKPLSQYRAKERHKSIQRSRSFELSKRKR